MKESGLLLESARGRAVIRLGQAAMEHTMTTRVGKTFFLIGVSIELAMRPQSVR
jgi:hypothetical protein